MPLTAATTISFLFTLSVKTFKVFLRVASRSGGPLGTETIMYVGWGRGHEKKKKSSPFNSAASSRIVTHAEPTPQHHAGLQQDPGGCFTRGAGCAGALLMSSCCRNSNNACITRLVLFDRNRPFHDRRLSACCNVLHCSSSRVTLLLLLSPGWIAGRARGGQCAYPTPQHQQRLCG